MSYNLKGPERIQCLECGDIITYGRADRKFCSDSCKNRYHNSRNHRYRSVHLRVLGILEKNYQILQQLLDKGVTSIDLGDLAQLGYNKEFATSYHKIRGRNEYRCFDIKFYCTESRIFRIERFG